MTLIDPRLLFSTSVQVTGGEGAAEVAITDAIPACHSFISLAPVLEAALSQVSSQASRSLCFDAACGPAPAALLLCSGAEAKHAEVYIPPSCCCLIRTRDVLPAAGGARQGAAGHAARPAHCGVSAGQWHPELLRLTCCVADYQCMLALHSYAFPHLCSALYQIPSTPLVRRYYQANERLSDVELGAGRRYADRIEATWPNSVALLVGADVHFAMDLCVFCSGGKAVAGAQAALQALLRFVTCHLPPTSPRTPAAGRAGAAGGACAADCGRGPGRRQWQRQAAGCAAVCQGRRAVGQGCSGWQQQLPLPHQRCGGPLRTGALHCSAPGCPAVFASSLAVGAGFAALAHSMC